jgi:hypothetical protein
MPGQEPNIYACATPDNFCHRRAKKNLLGWWQIPIGICFWTIIFVWLYYVLEWKWVGWVCVGWVVLCILSAISVFITENWKR